jgi:hypothetical protein
MSVRGIEDGVVAIEVVQREEDEYPLLGTIRAETCEVDADEPLRDRGTVDEVHTGVDAGMLYVRIVLHGGEITLAGPAIELTLDSVRAAEEDEDSDD